MLPDESGMDLMTREQPACYAVSATRGRKEIACDKRSSITGRVTIPFATRVPSRRTRLYLRLKQAKRSHNMTNASP
jgi:hypothetical protein